MLNPLKSPIQMALMKRRLAEEALKLKMTADLIRIHEAVLAKIDELNNNIDKKIGPEGERGPKGYDGHTPTAEELVALIKPLIPEVKDGETPTEEYLRTLIEPLIEQATPKRGVDFMHAGDIKTIAKHAAKMVKIPAPTLKVLAQQALPAKEVDHEMLAGIVMDKIIKGKKLKMEHLTDGLAQTESVARRFLVNGSKHGGGDTVAAGIGVTITDENGRKVINASTSGNLVRDEVPSGSGTAFTLAHTPIANTLQLFRGGARQQVGAGKDYTISGADITLALTLVAGEILLADYSY